MGNSDILITVVTCVYNTPIEYLKEAVGSILAQTHRNFEYYIVDDCSEKDLYSDELFKDERIKIVRLEKNCGPSIARNTAFDLAKGKYIAIMDSDDISLPDRFEKQIDFMEKNPDVVACGTWFTHFGDKTHPVERVIDDNEYYRACLLFGNAPTILNPSVMLRHSTMTEHGIRYDERLRKGEDYKMWVQLSQTGRCTNLCERLLYYRVHSSQASQRLRTKDVSDYDWIVMKEQFDAMKLSLTDEETAILRKDFRSREVDAFAYWKILQKILQANSESGFFDQEKLQKRVYEQWKMKIFNTPFPQVVALRKKLPKEENKMITRWEKQRILLKLGIGKHGR